MFQVAHDPVWHWTAVNRLKEQLETSRSGVNLPATKSKKFDHWRVQVFWNPPLDQNKRYSIPLLGKVYGG